MDSNDRYYILLRIEKKYSGTKVNLAPLKAELKRLRPEAVKETKTDEKVKPAPAAAAPVKSGDPANGTVNKITYNETGTESQILVFANNISKTNYFVLKDPDTKKPPKIVLDLYNATDELSNVNKSISIKTGIFSHVQSGQFEENPDKIVRVIADMRNERPYKIKNEGDHWVISAQKEKSEQTKMEPPLKAAPALAPAVPAVKQQPAKATKSYAIDIGDVLYITVLPAEELTREVVVQPEGEISMPLIGLTKAKGLTIDELAANVTKSLSKFISNPKVNVSIRKFSRRQIFITGEVHSLGTFDYKENLRLMEFISSIGGFNIDANRTEIKVYRGPSNKKQTFIINIEDVLKTGDFSKDFLLEPGDIIEVPKGSTKVSILGDVSGPGFYDFRDNMSMTELISNAHGFNDTANISDISIIRLETQNDNTIIRRVIKVNLKKILAGKIDDVVIKSGDTVYIPKLNIARANWFLNTVLPWLSLITIIIALGAKI